VAEWFGLWEVTCSKSPNRLQRPVDFHWGSPAIDFKCWWDQAAIKGEGFRGQR